MEVLLWVKQTPEDLVSEVTLPDPLPAAKHHRGPRMLTRLLHKCGDPVEGPREVIVIAAADHVAPVTAVLRPVAWRRLDGEPVPAVVVVRTGRDRRPRHRIHQVVISTAPLVGQPVGSKRNVLGDLL